MNARRLWVMAIVVGLMAVGVVAVAAQSGAGYGPGTGTCAMMGQPCPMMQNPMQTGMMGGMMHNHMGGRFGMGAHMQVQNGHAMGMGAADCPNGGTCPGAQTQAQNGAMNGGSMGRWGMNEMPGATALPLTDDVAAAMAAGWLDEAHAYAAYEQLITRFGDVVPFVQLEQAEAQHMSAWERQFARFGLTLPEAPAASELPTFATVQEACAAAEAIEQDNAGLYDTLLATFEGYPSLTQVATALQSASLNHHLPELELCAAS